MEESAPAVLLRDFVNTFDVEDGTEALATPRALTDWLEERGLLPPDGPDSSAADLAAARTLREGLRAQMLAHHGPATPEPTPGLDGTLAALPLRLALAPTGPALLPAGDGATAGLARLAAAVLEAVADGSWPRLKVCQESTCLWAFLDTSKNRSRSWCSMRVCGNRTKTRAYRARHRPSASH